MAPHELPETQMMKLSPFWLRINWFLKADYCLKIKKTLNGAYISIVACKISMYGRINSEACLMWNKIQFYTYSFKISFNLFYSASEKKKHCSLKQKMHYKSTCWQDIISKRCHDFSVFWWQYLLFVFMQAISYQYLRTLINNTCHLLISPNAKRVMCKITLYKCIGYSGNMTIIWLG